MKLSGIFKKATKDSSKINVQTINKSQLAKVVGGAEVSEPLPVTTQRGIEKEKIC